MRDYLIGDRPGVHGEIPQGQEMAASAEFAQVRGLLKEDSGADAFEPLHDGAREERQLKRELARLSRYDLLIIDEVGYIPLSTDGAQLLFQVFSDRYEKGSLLVTSNLAFAQWTSVFGEASLTAALLDRLTHHCAIHEFGWESLRFTDSLTRKPRTHSPVAPLTAATDVSTDGATRRGRSARAS